MDNYLELQKEYDKMTKGLSESRMIIQEYIQIVDRAYKNNPNPPKLTLLEGGKQ